MGESSGRRQRFGVVAGILFFGVLGAAWGGGYSYTLESLQNKPADPEQLRNLEERDVYLRKSYQEPTEERVDLRTRLAEAYIAEGKLEAAFIQLRMAVRLDAWALKQQVLLAELEMALDQRREARDRLVFAEREGEAAPAVEYARELLGREEFRRVSEAPTPPYLKQGRIYIVSYGQVPPIVLKSLKSRIAQEYGLTVEIEDRQLDIDPIHIRNNLEPYFDGVLENFRKNLPEETLREHYSSLGISPEEGPQGLQEKGRAVREGLLKREGGAAAWRIALWENQNQMDALEIYQQFNREVADLRKDPRTVGILGVTPYDFYIGKSDFVFGYGEDNTHIMSIHRFTGPNEVIRNALKMNSLQALTAVINMLEIPRATTKDCATAPYDDPRDYLLREDVLGDETIGRVKARYEELRG